MRHRWIIFTFSCIALATAGCATGAAELDIPSFSHLKHQAVESVDITIGSLPLALARHLVSQDDDPDNAEEMAVLKGLKSVSVRNYRFDSDFVYSKTELDKVRSQLDRPGWSQLVKVRDRKQNKDVDVFVAIDQNKIKSLAVITSEPREFTIVYIVGSIDVEHMGALKKQFHLPDPGAEQTSQNVQ